MRILILMALVSKFPEDFHRDIVVMGAETIVAFCVFQRRQVILCTLCVYRSMWRDTGVLYVPFNLWWGGLQEARAHHRRGNGHVRLSVWPYWHVRTHSYSYLCKPYYNTNYYKCLFSLRSRLGCQICLTKSLEGIVARVPESVADIRQSQDGSS